MYLADLTLVVKKPIIMPIPTIPIMPIPTYIFSLPTFPTVR